MIRRKLRLLAVALCATGLAGCLDLALISSVAFPPDIPGLDRDRPWVRLPVGSWVTDGAVQPVAIVGCFSPACSPGAAVGLFRARGPVAESLARAADDPKRLAGTLLEGRPRPPGLGKTSRPKIGATADPIREGAWRGFSLHLAREGGARPAYGAVLTRSTAGTLTVVLVVSGAEETALRIARTVAAHQG